MFRSRCLGAALLAAGLMCASLDVRAETPPRVLRLVGEAAGAKDPVPAAFALDLIVKPGDGDFQSRIEGWFAATAPPATSGAVSGSCVEKRCALTVELDAGKLTLTGDLLDAAGPVAARFALKDDQDKPAQSGAAILSPLTGALPNLGDLAAPDAIDAADLDDLLMWAHETVSSGSAPGDEPPSSFQRESVATWQNGKGRLATGLIFTSDLAELRADRAAAEMAAGWKTLGDKSLGWSAGYPSALLPNASQTGAEHRFASADGKAVLVIAIDAPMSSQDFDDFVEKTTADRDGRSHVNTTRVNSDLEMRLEEGGIVTVAAYHNREGGLARLVLTYPADRDETFDPFAVILQRQFKVSGDLKP